MTVEKVEKMLKEQNEKISYPEAEYCKSTDRTYSHVQLIKYDNVAVKIRFTHKVFIANGKEIRSFNSIKEIEEVVAQ